MSFVTEVSDDRLDSVQFLRAIAATAVVIFHIPLFRNGSWGVDIFFVISGFIMALVTAKSGRHFFAKRVIRVVPLYWLGTVGVFCVALLLPNLLDNTTADLTGLIKSLLFIPYQKGEYVQPLLFLGWTLNFEMFFYLLFALAMAISHRHRLLICSAVIMTLVVVGQVVTFEAVIPAFYTSQILAEFVLGMGCYAVYSRTRAWRAADPSRGIRTFLVVIGIACLATMPFSAGLEPLLGRAGVWGIPAMLGFLAIVHGLSGVTLPRGVVLIGDASYSLYLFHPYVMKVFNKVFHVFDAPGILAYLMTPLTIGLCYAVAIGMYRLVELPMTQWLRVRFLDPRRVATAPAPLPVESNE
ncbi:Peptidoglycan/LPS O-acetylase OafA/YrhL, contains acyltransferase and SGNH-hydrolase domains [Pseudomonas sp. ok272]|uniref:acyltransferase family protein n=1 Tax=unclassified Pseudomonas TaxID=196821 RepID=UPI0008BE6BB7|nr:MULTISPECIES: acyltransferase [unclassified Pseudomonas]SEN44873.1 Peptidoglycan/LPS O-acetylase OafA/YrhL, contains acyltransferase and SGNH-hydrolase domains [Pseudomonas sp. ok272]SFM80871.1 Peptidoglycan/LPS O-acetylase OafA/YrhL, contains acyltransferase and SGNH-hydrolase domains [Pseudomonas sp. ok602]